MAFGLGACGCACSAPALPVCGKISVIVVGCNNKNVAASPVSLYEQVVTGVSGGAGGSGYTSPPTVNFATTNGFGATATAVLSGGVVNHIDMLTGGAYTVAPVVTLTGGGGSGATGWTATLGSQSLIQTINTNISVTTFTFGTHGTNYTTIPNVTITGGGGTGAVATANLSAVAITAGVVDSGGSGYTSNPIGTLTGGGGSGGSVAPRLTAGPVTALRLLGGSGYANGSGFAINFSGGSPSVAATGTFDVIGNSVCNLVLTSGGSGYTSTPSIDFSGHTGTNATGFAVANLGTGVVTSVAVESGSGYTPGTGYALGFSGGVGGSAAAGTFDVDGNGKVTNLVITNGGSGYTTNPTLSFPGAGGSGAAATALLGPTSVGSLFLALAGSGYTSVPTYTIAAPTSGTTATGHVTLASQNVASLTIVNSGRDFTSVPTVTIDPPGSGTTATVTAVLATGESSIFYTTSIGRYTVSVVPPPALAWWGYTPITSAVSVPLCTTNASTTVTLTPATGYTCKCVFCRDPSPNTCTITDANGTYTATFNHNGWNICYTLPSQTVDSWNSGGAFCTTPTTTGTPATGFAVQCPTTSTGHFVPSVAFTGCSVTHLLPGTCAADGFGTIVPTGNSVSTAGTITAGTGGAAPNNCNDSVSYSVSISLVNGTVAVTFP